MEDHEHDDTKESQQWTTTDCANLINQQESLVDCVELVIEQLHKLTAHSYLAKAQAKHLKVTWSEHFVSIIIRRNVPRDDFEKVFVNFTHIFHEYVAKESVSRDTHDNKVVCKGRLEADTMWASLQKITMSHGSNSDLDSSNNSEQSWGDNGVVYGNYQPYANEPLAQRNCHDFSFPYAYENEGEDGTMLKIQIA